MRLKTLLLTCLVALISFNVDAQIESGKVYRIINRRYGKTATENYISHEVSCVTKGGNADYSEMWIVTETANASMYTIQNVYSGRNLHYESKTSTPWYTTDDTNYSLYIGDAPDGSDYLVIKGPGGGRAMHCDASMNCVPWEDKIEPSHWQFELVNITDGQIEAAREEYNKVNNVIENADAIAAAYSQFFADAACTELKAEYATMTDEALSEAMGDAIPADLKAVAMKVKNDTWDGIKREKEFRVAEYKPYSEDAPWKDLLFLRNFNRINNPTGICTIDSRNVLYVFVGNDIPEDATLYLCETVNTAFRGTETELKKGLNVVPCINKGGFTFVRYNVNTHSTNKKLADFPNIKVHIEGGFVNGFWSKQRGHTNDDWTYMIEHMFENDSAIQCVGDVSMFNFRKKELIAACPDNMEGVMGEWDRWNTIQQKYIGIDKYKDRFNNLQLAMSDNSGYMDASNFRTHYNNNTLGTICNYENITTNGEHTWGPNHEIGHTNQYAIEIVGTSEVSNNALANIVTFELGRHTSRGEDMTNCIKDYENGVNYVLRGEKTYGTKLFSMTRMYYQLFLYFHAAGHDTTFYPRLYDALREDRIQNFSAPKDSDGNPIMGSDGLYEGSMNALNDQLKFAEKCCEIAQMDLSEFFEAWGFFFPMKNDFVGDYGYHYVYLTKEDAAASKKRMQQYEKKGGHLVFLEDRVRPSKRRDGLNVNNGYRWDYNKEVPAGTAGDVGQWEDFIDTSVKAQGYYYTRNGLSFTIKLKEGAAGALGFKVFDGDGNLITFSNRYSFTVPASAREKELHVYVAQADGANVEIPSAAEAGTEDEQRTFLSASINTAKPYYDALMVNGDECGFYYPEYGDPLKEVYEAARAAYQNKDQSVHTYGQWSVLLDAAVMNIINSSYSYLDIKDKNVYILTNKSYSTYQLTTINGGLIATTNTAVSEDKETKQWEFISAGAKNEWYVRSKSGLYIAQIHGGQAITVCEDIKDAAVLVTRHNSNGCYDIFQKGNEGAAINCHKNNNYVARGGNTGESASRWELRLIEDNATAIEKNMLESLVEYASYISERNNLDVIELAEDREVALREMRNALADAEEAKEKGARDYAPYIEILGAAVDSLKAKYIAITPATTEGVAWYYLRDTEKSLYAGIVEGCDSTKLSALPEGDDKGYRWALVSDGVDGEYRIYNAATGACVYKDSKHFTLANGAEGVAEQIFAVEYNEENKGVTLKFNDANRYLNTSNSVYLKSSIKKGYWILEDVAFEAKDIVTGIEYIQSDDAKMDTGIYDLFGRKVEEVTESGIYIQNGKKVYIRK